MVRMRTKYLPVVVRERLIKRIVEIIKDNINEIVEEYQKKEKKAIILK